MTRQDLWLPEVEVEYFTLLKHSRDVGVDVGNQFRVFQQIVSQGVSDSWTPVAYTVSAKVYVVYGRSALMLFAISATKIAIVKWAIIGSEYQHQLAIDEAIARARGVFP